MWIREQQQHEEEEEEEEDDGSRAAVRCAGFTACSLLHGKVALVELFFFLSFPLNMSVSQALIFLKPVCVPSSPTKGAKFCYVDFTASAVCLRLRRYLQLISVLLPLFHIINTNIGLV